MNDRLYILFVFQPVIGGTLLWTVVTLPLSLPVISFFNAASATNKIQSDSVVLVWCPLMHNLPLSMHTVC